MSRRTLFVATLLLVLAASSVSADILSYDDGLPTYTWYLDTLLYYAVRFTPPSPCTVLGGMIWPSTPLMPGYQCTLFVWQDAGGVPGALVYDTLLNTFLPAYLDTFLVSPYWTGTNDFWIGYSTQDVFPVGRCFGQSDAFLNYPTRSYVSWNRQTWFPCRDSIMGYDGDLLIRAWVSYPQPIHDVGVQSIDVPDTLPCDTTISPRATVCNWGDSVETFRVDATIDSAGSTIYSSFRTLSALAVGACTSVTFNPWTVPHTDGFCYDLMVWTSLIGDDSTYNDTLTKRVCASCPAIHDVGADLVIEPPDTVACQDSFPVAGRVCNYGDTVETFDVEALIGGVYGDTVTVTGLGPGLCDTAWFRLWSVPPTHGVSYTVTLATLLGTDIDPGNDTAFKASLAWCPAVHDVGADLVVEPPDTVGCQDSVEVAARVCNYGDTLETFDVEALIDGVYGDTITVTDLSPGICDTFWFDNWLVPPVHGASYTVTVAALLGDTNPGNDTTSKTTLAWCPPGHDVGTEVVLQPPDIVPCEDPVPVSARVCNYGDTAETFDVEAVIDSGGPTPVYAETLTVVGLATTECDTVSFPNWVVPPVHDVLYTVTVTTLLLDANQANNMASKTALSWCLTYHDVGTAAILQPPDTVLCDSLWPVRAEVCNYGETTETFDARAIIDSSGTVVYGDTITVAMLPPDSCRPVDFQPWDVPLDHHQVSYTVTVTTMLPTDMDSTNNTETKGVIAWCPPGVEEILSAPGTASTFGLGQSRPNPAMGQVSIEYQLPTRSRVSLRVYDLSGTFVRTLVGSVEETGVRTATWDGRDDRGQQVASGIYFYKLEVTPQGSAEAGKLMAVRKLVLLR